MTCYTNYHLAISKQDYKTRVAKGVYSVCDAELTYEMVKPDYDKFLSLLKHYGHAWNWDKRPKYYNNRFNIERRLKSEESRLFIFYKDGKEIGYSLITPPQKFRGNKNQQNPHIIEIENIALAAEYTGQKYGRFFLQEIFATLFEKYETIYLSSRSTNHTGVVPFYLGMGMSVIHIDKDLPDDLIYPNTEEKFLQPVLIKNEPVLHISMPDQQEKVRSQGRSII